MANMQFKRAGSDGIKSRRSTLMRKHMTQSPKGKDGQASGEALLRLQSHQFLESVRQRHPLLSCLNHTILVKSAQVKRQ